MEIEAGGTGGTIRAGEFLDLKCIARGSRPPPDIMWYKGTESIKTKKSSLVRKLTSYQSFEVENVLEYFLGNSYVYFLRMKKRG